MNTNINANKFLLFAAISRRWRLQSGLMSCEMKRFLQHGSKVLQKDICFEYA